MPLVGKVLLSAGVREKNGGEAQGVRVGSGVAKGAFHLRRRQLGDRSTIRPTSDHPSFIESDLMARFAANIADSQLLPLQRLRASSKRIRPHVNNGQLFQCGSLSNFLLASQREVTFPFNNRVSYQQ